MRREERIYSVGQVNSYIRNLFTNDFLLKKISIKGEISNCKYHSSGHIYFTLKDDGGALRAVMFAGNRDGLDFRMQNGDSVIVTGTIDVYERDGVYQLYARKIKRDGLGVLYQRFEELKHRLEEMGMFAEQYKQPIPHFARTIGVVTAPTGAAIQDIRNITARRNPYVQLLLYPAKVQGEGAAESVVRGIRALEKQQVDVIIVGRGGGSIEDLWAFNEEIVARAIFECQIPVISAVGHQTDVTISDFVADLRAPTPSAAAELAVYDVHQFDAVLAGYFQQMRMLTQQKVRETKERLEGYAMQLSYQKPARQLAEKRRFLQEKEVQLKTCMEQVIQRKRHMLQLYAGQLDGLSPLKKMQEGYAVVTKENGKTLSSVTQAEPKETVRIHVKDGQILACVEKIETFREQEGE
ncbi:MAG: exodeoxyribonuclease VII large subunit [Lachnospiraceae bacterium]